MNLDSKIYVAGHRGMVGSAIVRELQRKGYNNLVFRTHAELDLTRQADVEQFFAQEKPEYVFLAAAKVGGIAANNAALADFCRLAERRQETRVPRQQLHLPPPGTAAHA